MGLADGQIQATRSVQHGRMYLAKVVEVVEDATVVIHSTLAKCLILVAHIHS